MPLLKGLVFRCLDWVPRIGAYDISWNDEEVGFCPASCCVGGTWGLGGRLELGLEFGTAADVIHDVEFAVVGLRGGAGVGDDGVVARWGGGARVVGVVVLLLVANSAG